MGMINVAQRKRARLGVSRKEDAGWMGGLAILKIPLIFDGLIYESFASYFKKHFDMKRYLSILVLLLVSFAVVQPALAQDDKKAEKAKEKAEKKLWKKKAKTYAKAPLSLRDDLDAVNKQLKDCNARNKELQGKFASQEKTIDSLQAALNAKIAELASLNSKYEKLQAAYEAQKNVTEKNIQPGLIYHVQVGAYVHFDMNQHLVNTDKTFEGENRDGMNKYMMGNFRDLKNAEAFRDDIRKLGIKDAWVVPYVDGTRVTMEEAAKYTGGSGNNTGPSTDSAPTGKDAIKNRNTGKDALKGK